MQETTNIVKDSSPHSGLDINRGKSKVLKINTVITKPVQLDNDLLEEVNSLACLGSVIGILGAMTLT